MSDFYDAIAGEYDAITGGDRTQAAEAFITRLTQRYELHSVLDVACGSGLYARLLANRGLRVVGADISWAMLQQARELSQQENVKIQWIHAPMQQLTEHVQDRFDAILCMGNSIPHLVGDADLDATLSGFKQLLNPGGIVVLHLLNYARILKQQERIVGVTRQGHSEYVRFYDFLAQKVRFNILEIDWSSSEPSWHLHKTLLRPMTADELSQSLGKHGFASIEVLSGLELKPLDIDRDPTVLLLARS